jgi:hypothetical protein
MPNVFALIYEVFLIIGFFSNDLSLCVLAVVCGEHSSRNPITVILLILGRFF